MKYIFLDYDGVIYPLFDKVPTIKIPKTILKYSPKCVEWLNQLYEIIPYQIIVIASLRKIKTFVEIQEIFKYIGINAEVIDMTGFIDNNRDEEILEIVKKLKLHPKEYIIIDDETSTLQYHIKIGNVVKPQQHIGFDEECLKQCLKYFN